MLPTTAFARTIGLLATAAVAVAAGIRVTQLVAPRSLAAALNVAVHRDAVRPWEAHVIVRSADCEANVDFLHLMERTRVTPAIRLRRAWVVEDTASIAQIAARLRARGVKMPVGRLPPSAVPALRALGVSRTPLLLVFDERGAVRLTSSAPRSPVEYAALAVTLEALRQTF